MEDLFKNLDDLKVPTPSNREFEELKIKIIVSSNQVSLYEMKKSVKIDLQEFGLILSYLFNTPTLFDFIFDDIAVFQEQGVVLSTGPRLFSNLLRVKLFKLCCWCTIQEDYIFKLCLNLFLRPYIVLSAGKIFDPFPQFEYLMVAKTQILVLNNMLSGVLLDFIDADPWLS